MQRLQASLTDLAPSQVISTGRPFDPERKLIMNRKTLSAIALVAAAFATGHAVAADASAPKTREQVKAELAEAIRTGDIVVGEGNQTHHWLNTQRRGRVL